MGGTAGRADGGCWECRGLVLSDRHALPPEGFKQESDMIFAVEKALVSTCKEWFEEGKTGDREGMAVLAEGENE